ncbi:MAG: hypothetical protein Q3980_16715 [Turicibacter sp.]|nr:hypothetical protein [Turicibacter sp.]
MEELVTCECCFWNDGNLDTCDVCGKYYCEDCGVQGDSICGKCKEKQIID